MVRLARRRTEGNRAAHLGMVNEAASPPNATAGDAGRGYVGRIPVRNLWLLMLYASDLFRMLGRDNLAYEDNPDQLPDLVAEILAHAVERRQRRQLSLGYRRRNAVISRVRGRIDVLTTARRQLLARGRVACRFDELTIDTPRNRFVRAALEKISRLATQGAAAHRCRKLAYEFKTMGVAGLPPSPAEMRSDHFGRRDADDRFMVAAALLAFELALPTELPGSYALPLPDREERWVRLLFERAVGGFYDVTLSRQGWQVRTGVWFDWQTNRRTPNIDRILPRMCTDIVLEHSSSHRRIVIDTKFTSILTKGWYRDETLRSRYLYQIYAYLRSQAGRGDSIADHAEGLLLHPSVGGNIDETAVIQGHAIRFATVDLAASSSMIRQQLLNVVEPSPGIQANPNPEVHREGSPPSTPSSLQ